MLQKNLETPYGISRLYMEWSNWVLHVIKFSQHTLCGRVVVMGHRLTCCRFAQDLIGRCALRVFFHFWAIVLFILVSIAAGCWSLLTNPAWLQN